MPNASAQNRETTGDPARLLETLHCLRVAVTIFDPQGRLVFANAHLSRIFRALPPLSTLLGKRYEEIIRLELPEIAPPPLGTRLFISARLAQLEPGAWEPMDIDLADGRIVEIKARRDSQGSAILIWTDVTQARHQFAQLQEAIRLSADAFAFFDAADCFVTGNGLYAQLTGITLEAMQSMSFEEIITSTARDNRLALDLPVDQWVARRLRGHRQGTFANTLETKDGTAYLVRDRATPDGGRAVVFIDITEKTRAENALAQTQNALEQTKDEARRQTGYLAALTQRLDQASSQAENAKTMFLRTMSHELKTPLNAILGFSDLMITLAGTLRPEQIRDYAGLIRLGGHNLLKMLNQIMDLTKIAAGRYELQKRPVDVEGLLWQQRANFVAKAHAKGVRIDANSCPPDVMVMADEAVLGGMLNALLDNAVAFTPRGGTITLTAAPVARGICIRIADDGPGVAAQDLDRILEPFEQAGRAVDHVKGAGLGLTLVKAFAELHTGGFEIRSLPGQGFSALLTLPAAA